jgi:hypothetical protein
VLVLRAVMKAAVAAVVQLPLVQLQQAQVVMVE